MDIYLPHIVAKNVVYIQGHVIIMIVNIKLLIRAAFTSPVQFQISECFRIHMMVNDLLSNLAQATSLLNIPGVTVFMFVVG